ncbi:MAG: YceI family protein [Pacificimonas sp.]|jgi:polyisoprenoid-binding protein YceI|nr:YceI family protein [Pacificimonas sp.]
MRLVTALAASAIFAIPVAAYQVAGTGSDEAAATQLAPMVMTTPPAPEAFGKRDTSTVEAGTYTVDTGHTTVTFTVDHLGFSSYTGQFGDPTGTLTLDPANPAAASVEVTFPISGVSTTSDQLDQHLMSADFFTAEEHPNATFTSTDIVVEGQNAAIRGDLTMNGQTNSVVLQTQFYGAGVSGMSNKLNIGFRAVTTIDRSDWGIDYAIPMVSDEVLLVIDAAFILDDEG